MSSGVKLSSKRILRRASDTSKLCWLKESVSLLSLDTRLHRVRICVLLRILSLLPFLVTLSIPVNAWNVATLAA